MDHFADRLVAAIRRKGNALCVGLDPRWDSLPLELQKRHADATPSAVAAMYEEFCDRVLDVVGPLVPVVKPQSAFFEACGPDGLRAMQHVLHGASERGLITILDGKRNDIAATAEAYADAAFAGVRFGNQLYPIWDADALTVNPYLGRDALEPFLRSARRSCRGLFVLVRTSNPGAGQFQDLSCAGRPFFYHVADGVGAWTRENLGQCGFGDVGAVIGATSPEELIGLRRLLPQCLFLVPGFGVQGANAVDCAGAFRDDGLGAVVNSSRGIIFAFQPEEPAWETRVEAATRDAIRALAEFTAMGRLALA